MVLLADHRTLSTYYIILLSVKILSSTTLKQGMCALGVILYFFFFVFFFQSLFIRLSVSLLYFAILRGLDLFGITSILYFLMASYHFGFVVGVERSVVRSRATIWLFCHSIFSCGVRRVLPIVIPGSIFAYRGPD